MNCDKFFRVYGRVYNGGLDENLSGMMKTHLLECEKVSDGVYRNKESY